MTILHDLQELRLTAVDLLVAVINGNGEFKTFRNTLFSLKNHTSLVGLLDTLVQDKKGCPIVSDWMLLHVLGLVCDKIHTEMEAAKPCLQMNTGNVSLEFIEHWDIHKVMGPVANNITPTLTSILDAAEEYKASCSKPKSEKSITYSHGTNPLSVLQELCKGANQTRSTSLVVWYIKTDD